MGQENKIKKVINLCMCVLTCWAGNRAISIEHKLKCEKYSKQNTLKRSENCSNTQPLPESEKTLVHLLSMFVCYWQRFVCHRAPLCLFFLSFMMLYLALCQSETIKQGCVKNLCGSWQQMFSKAVSLSFDVWCTVAHLWIIIYSVNSCARMPEHET